MRLFVAVLPPEEVREDLDAFLDPRRDVSGPRWAPPEQWHATLAFVPAAPERTVEPLVEACTTAAARFAPVPLALAGGGCFPDVTRARVLWAGLSGGEALSGIAGALRAAAATVGAAPDGGRFRPHVTLGRFGRPGDATRWVRVLDAYRGPPWTAEEVVLLESHLPRERGHRPRHEVLARVPLGG
ncbi:RNA 2',3'-cyclic phosphodiesterase [Phycicoccus flavus]|uniref:RNA 2',3'-cyclic phosphodiesterase n=1 Tax=Phycicoccus flavus TaxID=2502783 RepID=A0A8T6R1P7_9MICO|nr:RNA 2',3'-cyclic phosphodiesterase [Phycicoccus flavus]NHA67514.1 RNA 2',3'-cyclic phosphodiesterase [Phycicoccus flavus]